MNEIVESYECSGDSHARRTSGKAVNLDHRMQSETGKETRRHVEVSATYRNHKWMEGAISINVPSSNSAIKNYGNAFSAKSVYIINVFSNYRV